MKPGKPRPLADDLEASTPSVWIRQNADSSISYGVSGRGKSVRRQATAVMAAFTQIKHFVEVEVPAMTAANLMKVKGE